MYLVNYGVNLERTFSPSAEVSSSLLLCSFLSSPILVCRKWEELGRNLGGTWEEHGRNLGGTIRMCGRAFLRNGARLRFSRTKLLIFSHRQRFVLKVCCFCPEYWFFRDDTDYWMWRETNRMQRCFYVFEIWDNWDKLDKWGDNWDLR